MRTVCRPTLIPTICNIKLVIENVISTNKEVSNPQVHLLLPKLFLFMEMELFQMQRRCTLFVVNSAALTYNAALNRPAYQSSTYTDRYGTYPADRANDGSRHTRYNTSTKCAVTNYTANPWWAVDLGHPTIVYKVYLTSSVLNESRKCL